VVYGGCYSVFEVVSGKKDLKKKFWESKNLNLDFTVIGTNWRLVAHKKKRKEKKRKE